MTAQRGLLDDLEDDVRALTRRSHRGGHGVHYVAPPRYVVPAHHVRPVHGRYHGRPLHHGRPAVHVSPHGVLVGHGGLSFRIAF